MLVACLRPDPLERVPHVEDLGRLAAGHGLLIAGAAALALGASMLPFVALTIGARATPSFPSAVRASLAFYLAGALAATELGAFPVPVMGAAPSHTFGY